VSKSRRKNGRGVWHVWRFWRENLKERDHLEELGVDENMILKWISKK
jgi:hypothetical protein